MGSKSKMNLMKSYKINKKEAEQKLKKQKKENALDIISKSFFNSLNGSGKKLIFKSIIMSSIKNHVQLMGNVGQEPSVTTLESGKKVARFTLATNEHYKNAKGDKQTDTNWHTVVAWGKTAEVIEKYVTKGKELAVVGKLKTRSYTADDGNQRHVTEVEAGEILLIGTSQNTTKD